jgi:hypothetical protein
MRLTNLQPRPAWWRSGWRSVCLEGLVLIGVILTGGCAQTATPAYPASYIQPTTQPDATAGLQPPRPQPTLQTVSPIPQGWKADPAKHSTEHDHQAWLSPTRRTAYGVITFNSWLLPLASDQLVLDKFLQNMKKSEGEANLLAVRKDPNLDGLRFIAEGGQYTVRGNLVTRGTRGWVVYAGTLRRQPLMPDELELAERAREQTVLGVSQHADAR